MEPYDGDHLILLGRLYLESVQMNDAEREFKRALDLDPSEDRYVAWLGRAYLAQGRFEDRIAQYELAAAMAPREASHVVAIGFAYINTGRDPAVAEKYFQGALDVCVEVGATNLEIAQASYGLALTHLARGDCESALPYFQEAARLDPTLMLARAYLRQCQQVAGFEDTTLPPELTQRSFLVGRGALTMLIDSLSAMGIDTDANFQSTGEGAELLAVVHLAPAEAGTSEFIAERNLVMYASSLVASRLVRPQVDGIAVLSVNGQGTTVGLLTARIREAKYWEMGILSDTDYTSLWREVEAIEP